MEEIDKWAAEQCGVEVFQTKPVSGGVFLWTMPNGCIRQWTIQDPRCREIVREHFDVQTMQYQGTWFCAWNGGTEETINYQTIAEAEIACIKEIHKS